MSTKVSIITVSYNSAATIKKTIESVLSQTVHPYEHIFIDGKSSDETASVIQSYSEAYQQAGISMKLISEPDEGYYDAMNKGVHLAQGDVIGILNSDDWYEPDAIKHVAHYAAQHPDSDIFMGNIYIHNKDQIILKRAKADRYYQTSRHFNHPAMFARKSAYDQVGDYINGNVHNDYGWYLKALKMGKRVITIPEVLTNFSIGGVSSKKSFRNTLKRIGLKYEVYRNNGYSRLYWIECCGQELVKFLIVKR